MAKTLQERGYPIIDVHGHHGNLRALSDGNPSMLPPITQQQITLERYFRYHELTTERLLETLTSKEEMIETLKKYGVRFCTVAWMVPIWQWR